MRLLAAKFSRSASVPADKVEWILADTDRVDPEVVLVIRERLASVPAGKVEWILADTDRVEPEVVLVNIERLASEPAGKWSEYSQILIG